MNEEEIGKWSLKKLSARVLLLAIGKSGAEMKMRSITDLSWLLRVKKVEEPSLIQVNEASKEEFRSADPVLSEELLPHSV